MNSPEYTGNILDPDSVRVGVAVYGNGYAWYETHYF